MESLVGKRENIFFGQKFLLIEILRLLPHFTRWHHFSDEVIEKSNETVFSEKVFLKKLYMEY